MTFVTKRATVTPSGDTGEFDAILSTPSVDREGESLASHSWKQPLQRISITVDHTGSVADVVASGQPYLAPDGSLRLKGRFAATDKGQQVRQLVVGGDIDSLSVEFLRSKGADGAPVHELTGASFVLLPANPDAKVLSAKAFGEQVDLIVKAASGGDLALMQAAHDAMVHLSGGAVCGGFADPDSDADMDASGVGDGANKSLEAKALQLRLKALAR